MNKTAAVVVTYNRIQLLKECVAHLQTQTVPVDILIIDNASTDGTGDLFKEPKDSILYFNTGANLGGAGGFNYGMRKACELGYEFVWVMDDDTLPEPAALEKLLEADEKLGENYGWLSSLALWKDRTPCRMNIQKITKWKYVKRFDDIQTIQYASFVSLFLKSETIYEYGLPYKEFFIWSDDWEYTRRISKYKAGFLIPGSIVNHQCKSNKGADIVTASSDQLDRFRYLYRNDVVLYRQDGFEGIVFLALRFIKHASGIIFKSNNKKAKLSLILKSTIAGMTFRPQVEYPESE